MGHTGQAQVKVHNGDGEKSSLMEISELFEVYTFNPCCLNSRNETC